ncbi:polysaccharide biosynthesis tyrosine autokinase [Nocardioides jensenii]|uniref:polysaccharide biosynthesis tyrosine autokinase n=1 Tax=Nocardioides jensenii TaxID=1843 RepID=UPI000832CE10|nr:polysaccharide biosynthesis tyrosine autokinase [Nocardioides jensenii]
MELSDYLRMLRNYWIGVLVITAAVVAAAGVYNVTQPKVYAANANGFVSIGSGSDPALASVGDSLAKSRAKSFVDIAESRATAQEVIDTLGLDTTTSSLIGSITVEQPEDTVSIKITAAADTPQEAQALADAWIQALARQVKSIENPNDANDQAIRVVAVESAELPGSPVSPKVERNLGLGLVLGLMLGFGYALLRSQFDRRIRSAATVEKEFGVSVVGLIPTARVLARDVGRTAMLAVNSTSENRSDQSAAEAFRKLRTNLQFMSVDDPPRVIVLTSPKPGDGKSTIAANLAAAIAASGSPVILVDGDLRRPTVADSFDLVEGAGLTDVLVGRVEIDDVLQQHGTLENLQVLAAGGIPPNPSELLGSQAMQRLLTSLSERATVIIDAPPLLPVTDGAVLTAVTDGAFVVISSGKTLDTELAAALSHLEAVHGKALGVIFNGMPARDVYSSYYYRSDEGTHKDTGAAPRSRAASVTVH